MEKNTTEKTTEKYDTPPPPYKITKQMTPKEKAIEIYNKMNNEVDNRYGTDFVAKQCSLLAVDEILYVCDLYINYHHIYGFYLEVKQELEKI